MTPSSSPVSSAALLVLAASVLSSALTAVFVIAWVGPARAAEPQRATAGDSRLAGLLERVADRLDEAPLASPTTMSALPRQPAESASRAGGTDLEELLQRVADELAERRVRVALPLESAPELQRDVPPIPAAIASQVALYEADRPAAQREIRLLNPTQVIERFGSPTRVEATNVHGYDMWWCWDEPYSGALEAYFKSGYLIYSSCRTAE